MEWTEGDGMDNTTKHSATSPDQYPSAEIASLPAEKKPALLRSDSRRNLPGSIVSQGTFASLLRAARNNGMFSTLSESDAELVFSLCHFGFVDHDVRLFNLGDQAEYLLFIAEGRVNVLCPASGGKMQLIGTAGIGAILGESAITTISQRTAAVVTATRCALGYLYYDDFNRLCSAHPEVALRFMIMMFNQTSGRMRSMINQLIQVSQVRAAAETSLELLSKALGDGRGGAPR
jgi:CRP-like cAMP-binding protein